MTHFVPLSEISPAALERLLDRAFGPDRYGRTAYKVRAGTLPIDSLCFGVRGSDDEPVGSIQAWPVELLADSGAVHPLIMVGPVAVDPDYQRDGIGQALMHKLLNRADAMDTPDALMLIGDPEYYGRFFGFSAEHTGQWRLPGPVQPRRLLARGRNVPSDSGILRPRLYVSA